MLAATRPWIKFLDGDDLLLPGATIAIVDALEKAVVGPGAGNGIMAHYRGLQRRSWSDATGMVKHLKRYIRAFGMVDGCRAYTAMHLASRAAGAVFPVVAGGRMVWLRRMQCDISTY